MEDLKALIDTMVSVMQIPFTLWGFTFSFWEVMLCVLIGSIIIYAIGRFLF